MDVIKAIKNIYPNIDGGFMYWSTKKDGKDLSNPEDGLKWYNETYSKPTWQNIEDSWDEIKSSILKEKKTKEIKAEAKKRILAIADEATQVNYIAEVSEIINKSIEDTSYVRTATEQDKIDASKTMKANISAVRDASAILKTDLDSMTDSQLEAFDATDESNWS
jgi:hypothetical protein